MKIINIYPNFKNRGGAQNVAITLAKELNKGNEPIILTNTPIKQIHEVYKKEHIKFEHFSIIKILKYNRKEVVFLSHHRFQTTLIMIVGFFVSIKLIHVAHNTFTNLKYISLFPKNIIAVSNGVKNNLINYFNIAPNRINVIYNGVKDIKITKTKNVENTNIIKILIAGRICAVKQQVDIVKHTIGKINNDIYIFFAGEGDMMPQLSNAIGNSLQYKILGYINLRENIENFDYVCLFSKKEGFSMTLIEGCTCGKPLITNNIDVVVEINKNEYNGFVCDNWTSFINCLNNLPNSHSDEYKRMSKNARNMYEQFFNERQMILGYTNFINELYG